MSQTITFPVALGDEVRDRVTGFTGIVIALTEWFNRCQRATVQPSVEEGKTSIPSPETIDTEQLEVITANKTPQKVVPDNTNQPGGPMPSMRDDRSARDR